MSQAAAHTHARVRLAEVIAALSLATDLAMGQPMAFALRSCVLSVRLGEALALANLPTLFVFEGGYAVAEVGVNAVNVLTGFENS